MCLFRLPGVPTTFSKIGIRSGATAGNDVILGIYRISTTDLSVGAELVDTGVISLSNTASSTFTDATINWNSGTETLIGLAFVNVDSTASTISVGTGGQHSAGYLGTCHPAQDDDVVGGEGPQGCGVGISSECYGVLGQTGATGLPAPEEWVLMQQDAGIGSFAPLAATDRTAVWLRVDGTANYTTSTTTTTTTSTTTTTL